MWSFKQGQKAWIVVIILVNYNKFWWLYQKLLTLVIRERCLSTENCLVSGLFRSKEVQLTLFGARLGLNRKVVYWLGASYDFRNDLWTRLRVLMVDYWFSPISVYFTLISLCLIQKCIQCILLTKFPNHLKRLLVFRKLFSKKIEN